MTIKFGNCANFIVTNFVVIWEAPILWLRKMDKMGSRLLNLRRLGSSRYTGGRSLGDNLKRAVS